jgi:hypothetical protein
MMVTLDREDHQAEAAVGKFLVVAGLVAAMVEAPAAGLEAPVVDREVAAEAVVALAAAAAVAVVVEATTAVVEAAAMVAAVATMVVVVVVAVAVVLLVMELEVVKVV